ncbi:hypothetical protein FA13DRAFT_1791365 [Coprinellus micaceus]|uniref:Uncharacterized protein n=1 Tax=Coprinellus micaceus TaxID=71717 RepID=A0A4Y7TBM7_COPMI|nr:hypothetical protein FA13DRAFT_1791365 [Coprinellus micaceus]
MPKLDRLRFQCSCHAKSWEALKERHSVHDPDPDPIVKLATIYGSHPEMSQRRSVAGIRRQPSVGHRYPDYYGLATCPARPSPVANTPPDEPSKIRLKTRNTKGQPAIALIFQLNLAKSLAMDSATFKPEATYMLVATFTEALFYGLYASLFFVGLHLRLKESSRTSDRSEGHAVVSQEKVPTGPGVTFGVGCAMFGVATVHISLTASQLIRGSSAIDSRTASRSPTPIEFERIICVILAGVQFMLCDALTIYRCYIIWKRSIYVTVLPFLLAVSGIAVTSVTCAGLSLPSSNINVDIATYARYSLALAQSVTSTGLIIWRIWRQHRLSQNIGLQVVNGVRLTEVIVIMLESASLYTIQLVILNVTNYLRHPCPFCRSDDSHPHCWHDYCDFQHSRILRKTPLRYVHNAIPVGAA